MSTETKNGLTMSGELQGVDFVASGKGVIEGSPISWGASVKLNFSIKNNIVKTVSGVEIKSTAMYPQTIQISTTDDLLPIEVEKYNKMVGKFVSLQLAPQKNATFKLL